MLIKNQIKRKMGDIDYEKQYLEQKKKSKKVIYNLKKTKSVQEIYHRIMGTPVSDDLKDDEPSN